MPRSQTPHPRPALWDRVGVVPQDVLVRARLELHHASQLLASFGQALLEPMPDDSHRSMTWEEPEQALRTSPASDGLTVRLVVPSFRVELWRHEIRLAVLALAGEMLEEARSWLEDQLAEAQGGKGPRLAWPEYELPERGGSPGAPLRPDPKGLLELATWYGNGLRVLREMFSGAPEASAIRCWPHHFDLATLLTFEGEEDGGGARYVGVGLSPGDDALSYPYLYVNGWPPPAQDALPPLRTAGTWHTEGWVGAVLGAEEIVSQRDAAEQEETVMMFLDTATQAMRTTMLGDR